MAEYVRYKFANGSGSTSTVTFDEGTALDSTHVLVAFAYRLQGSDIPAVSGWTKVSENTSNRRMAIFMRRGNGSVNSFPGTGSNVQWATSLLAYKSDEGSLELGSSHNAATGSGITSTSSGTITPNAYGVAVSFLASTSGNNLGARTWNNGLAEVMQHSSLYCVAESVRDTAITPSVNWANSAINVYFGTVFIPLEEPVDPAVPDARLNDVGETPLYLRGLWTP